MSLADRRAEKRAAKIDARAKQAEEHPMPKNPKPAMDAPFRQTMRDAQGNRVVLPAPTQPLLDAIVAAKTAKKFRTGG